MLTMFCSDRVKVRMLRVGYMRVWIKDSAFPSSESQVVVFNFDDPRNFTDDGVYSHGACVRQIAAHIVVEDDAMNGLMANVATTFGRTAMCLSTQLVFLVRIRWM